MFRLMQDDRQDYIVITIEGELQGESVRIAESTCLDALLKNVPVTILINNVTEMDAGGCEFLKRMASSNVQLRAIGIYSQYVIDNAQQFQNRQ